jgi:hypothetical protein
MWFFGGGGGAGQIPQNTHGNKKGGCLHSITMHKFFGFPQQSSTAIGPTG